MVQQHKHQPRNFVKDFENEEMVRRFENITKSFAQIDSTLTNKALASVVGALLQFMETHLGRDATGPRPVTKIPFSVFTDFTEHGTLSRLLHICFKLKEEFGWRRFELSNPSKKDKAMEFVIELHRRLKESGVIPAHRLFISEFVDPKDAERIVAVATELGMSTVKSKTQATHVIYPRTFCDEGDANDEYLRCLQTTADKKRCYVHIWYYPDSYDHWVPSTEVEGDPDPVDATRQQYHLSMQWVFHSQFFNEMMNELDYEVPDETLKAIAAPPIVDKTKKKDKRKKDPPAIPDNKKSRTMTEEPEEVVIEPKPATSPALPVVVTAPSSPIHSPATITATTSETHTAPSPASAMPLPTDKLDTNGALIVQNRQKQPDAPVVRRLTQPPPRDEENRRERSFLQNISQVTPQKQIPEPPVETPLAEAPSGPTTTFVQVLVPSYAAWFSLDTVHAIERRSLPEFFNNTSRSRTPKSYRELRNFMVEEWRKRPDEHLTVTLVRKQIAADVAAVFRVHLFLEHWGLINFHSTTLVRNPVPLNSSSDPAPPKSEGSVKTEPRVVVQTGAGSQLSSLPLPPNLRNDFVRLSDAAEVSQQWVHKLANTHSLGDVRIFCNQCQRDCTSTHYVSNRIPYVTVCVKCFGCGQYHSSLSHDDFTKVVQNEGAREASSEWTEDEELLLLEALERYGDNWIEVAGVVQTKSKDQCITHFCRMPITDKFLNSIPHSSKSTPELPRWNSFAVAEAPNKLWDASRLEGVDRSQLPFSQAMNPLLSQITFLASMVSPSVASAAAAAALQAIGQTTNNDTKEKSEDKSATATNGYGTQSPITNIRLPTSTTICANTTTTIHSAIPQPTASASPRSISTSPIRSGTT
eukprot:c6854_g1_i2.p1 GENE.c6854_g1_i2~~c6854_g1_i2.p1  ORF type:complete len:866 (-),score=181.84 c6854_g1_i2:298-2895(-)